MLILFVDDEEDDCLVFCEALAECRPDAKCIYARDGAEALNLLTEVLAILPDYIFMDINMPKMSGGESLSKMKTNPVLTDVPVYMYSTTKDAREIQTFIKIGAAGYITKTGEYTELVRVLTNLFSR